MRNLLIKLYLKNPCAFQANALWKTLNLLENFEHFVEIEKDEIKIFKLWKGSFLHTYFSESFNNRDFDNFEKVLIHEKFLNSYLLENFPNKTSFFRLIHKNKNIPTFEIPEDYYFKNVEISKELNEVSEFICKCYENIKPNSEEVNKWTKHDVFNNDLWVWIVEKNTGNKVALGIAEVDKEIREGSLEWIQVLPDFQGKKLGKLTVLELLRRMEKNVDFTTVSGETDNKTNPEILYRKCGFEGNDVWYLMSK